MTLIPLNRIFQIFESLPSLQHPQPQLYLVLLPIGQKIIKMDSFPSFLTIRNQHDKELVLRSVPIAGLSISDNISTNLNTNLIEYQISKPGEHYLDNWLVHYDKKKQGIPTPPNLQGFTSALRFFGRDPQTGLPIILIQYGTWEFYFKPLQYWSSDAFIVRSYLPEYQYEQPLVVYRNPKVYFSPHSDLQGANLTFSTEDLIYFLYLIGEDYQFVAYLQKDYTFVTSDKYILALAFLYLKGAKYIMDYENVNNITALAALSLANETLEETPCSISSADNVIWFFKQTLPPDSTQLEIEQGVTLLKEIEFYIAKKLDYNLIISKEACVQVMDIFPMHPVWARDRENSSSIPNHF